jgi:hypothetical protein
MQFLTRFCCRTQTAKPAPQGGFFLSAVPSDRSWLQGREQNPLCKMLGTNSLLENHS